METSWHEKLSRYIHVCSDLADNGSGHWHTDLLYRASQKLLYRNLSWCTKLSWPGVDSDCACNNAERESV